LDRILYLLHLVGVILQSSKQNHSATAYRRGGGLLGVGATQHMSGLWGLNE